MEKNTKNLIIFLTNLWNKVKDFTFKTEVVNQIEIPEVNIPEVNFPEYPDNIKVNNLDSIEKTIEGNTNKVVASLSKELQKLIPKDKNKDVVKALKSINKTVEKEDLTPKVIEELKGIVKKIDNKNIDLSSIEEKLESLKYILGEVKRYDELKVRLPEKQLKEIGRNMSVSVSGGMSKGGLATSAKQDAIISELTDANTGLDAIELNQTDGTQKTQIIDSAGDNLLTHDRVLGVMSDGHLMAEDLIAGHQTLFKIGYNPAITTTEETVWSAGGTYVFPTAEQQMEVVSSDNTNDIGVVIKGDATGNTVQSDADGTTTTLEDDDVDFTAATAVAVGDCVILDPHGANPEFGTVTAVAAHTLTIAGGFNKGGSGASRYYAVVDMSAHTGATVIQFGYLDGDYVIHREIVVLNGTTPVNTVNTDIYRINGVSVVCAGSDGVPTGNISLRNTAGTVTYGYITAGYNVSRQAVFTIPAGITGYLTSANISASTPNDSKVQSCRIIVRSNTTPDEDFTSRLFYPKAEFDITNGAEEIQFEIPVKFVEKSDFIVSAQGFTGFSGPVVGVFRGFLIQND